MSETVNVVVVDASVAVKWMLTEDGWASTRRFEPSDEAPRRMRYDSDETAGIEEGASSMERLHTQQRWIIAVVASIVAVVCLGNFIYWVAIVENHPWFKHSLLFAVLAIAGLAVAAYAWPRATRTE